MWTASFMTLGRSGCHRIINTETDLRYKVWKHELELTHS